MGVGDDQLDTTQAATGELAQKLGPDWLGLRCSDLQAQNFATAIFTRTSISSQSRLTWLFEMPLMR